MKLVHVVQIGITCCCLLFASVPSPSNAEDCNPAHYAYFCRQLEYERNSDFVHYESEMIFAKFEPSSF